VCYSVVVFASVVVFLTIIARFGFVAVILREFTVVHLVEVLHYKAKDSGLIPVEVIRIFPLLNPFCSTMALGSTHPLTQLGTRNISAVGKAAGAKGIKFLPFGLTNF
jgi:hypothetical protein